MHFSCTLGKQNMPESTTPLQTVTIAQKARYIKYKMNVSKIIKTFHFISSGMIEYWLLMIFCLGVSKDKPKHSWRKANTRKEHTHVCGLNCSRATILFYFILILFWYFAFQKFQSIIPDKFSYPIIHYYCIRHFEFPWGI